MISAATIAVACGTGTRRLQVGPEWFTNGYFMVRDRESVKFATDTKPAAAVEQYVKLTKRPVLEAVELRIERKVRMVDCECDECGHAHEREEADDMGQMVFVADGGSTVVDPRMGHLFDGLTVFRDATPGVEPKRAALMGFDDGEMVVVVMPLTEPVRDPRVIKAVAR